MLNRQLTHGSGNATMKTLQLMQLRTGAKWLSAMRKLSPLPIDAQRVIDRRVTQVGLQRLAIVQDVISEGLVTPLTNWLAVPELTRQKSSRSGRAQRSMLPGARGERQVRDMGFDRLPIFCTFDDFEIDIRTLMVAERVGQALDTTMVGDATRNVNEALEDQAIFGAGFNVGGMSAPGLLNATGTSSYVIPKSWNDPTITGALILKDVTNAWKMEIANRRFGPYTIYVGTDYNVALSADYKDLGDETIMARIKSIETGANRPINIVPADMLPADTFVMVCMTDDVIDYVYGQDPTPITWSDPNGLAINSIVMACGVLRINIDYEGKSGIVVGKFTA